MHEIWGPRKMELVRRNSPRHDLLMERLEWERNDELRLFGSRYRRLQDLGATETTLKSELRSLKGKLRVSLEDPKSSQEIFDYLQTTGLGTILFPTATDLTADEMGKKIVRVSDRRMSEFLDKHRELYWEKERELNKETPILKKDFLDQIERAVEEGRLPQISLPRVRKIVSSFHTELIDVINTNRLRRRGDMSHDDESVGIGITELTDGTLRDTFFHEAFHAIAGSTLIFTEDEVDKDWDRLFSTHSGLANTNGRWLNEAVTEHLTLMLLDDGLSFDPNAILRQAQKEQEDRKGNSYFYERALLGWVMRLGDVDPQRMLRAYFEDFNPEAEKGYRARSRKAFYKEITKKFGKGFLRKLDVLINKYGIRQVAIAMKQEGPLILEVYGRPPKAESIESFLLMNKNFKRS